MLAMPKNLPPNLPGAAAIRIARPATQHAIIPLDKKVGCLDLGAKS